MIHENNENKKEMMRINHINPWDILPSIFQIQIPLNHAFLYESNNISNVLNSHYYSFLNDLMESLEKKVEKKIVVGPLEIWNILAKWLNLPKDLVEFFDSELESSVKYQEYSYKNPKPIPSFISTSVEWEQSLIESHPFHPLHKSRKAVPPLPDIEPGTYDFENPLIRFVSVTRDKVNIRGSFEKNILDIINIMSLKPNIFTDDNRILIPIHELQLPMIKEKFSYVEILPEKYSIKAKSYANLRTIIFPNLPDRSFKLPLAMRLTSAIRTISPWSAYIGTELLPIFERLVVNRNILRITYEKSFVISAEQDFDVAKHLACIIREDGVDDRDESEKVILSAGLVERDENGSTFLPPVIYNGFTFEPHLQNTRVRFNSKDRLPIGFIIRDNGGIRFHQETLFDTIGMRVETIPGNSYESKDLYDVYDKLYHSLIYNHVRLIVCSIHLHHSGIGWEIVRKHLSNIIPADHLLRKLWLEKETSEGKCFLRMKFEGKFRDSEEEGITMECSPKIN
ncbi:11718_t:CDS:2 [Diversispora eburnea]|uniref:11718_t:CDS:1 n=1 Tax=Diversispora eburnea TaxID=1213867 RepID=A0A9N8UYW1_9GLOM|nr:11718_t:CDS:2 [Diversispora eburnea]